MSLGSLGIPIWRMPEGMQIAVLEGRSKKAEQVQGILRAQDDERQEVIRERIRIAPGKSTKTLLEQCGFEEKDGIFPDFQGRTVLDIGGGFGGIAPLLSQSKCSITVVDPIFSEGDIEAHYQHDLQLATNRMKTHPHPEDITATPELRRMRKESALENQRVFDELNWWKSYDPEGKHQQIKRNPSYAEDIVGIPDSSQDYVVMKCVLFKDTVQTKKCINEVHRVLRSGGCFILFDEFSDDEKRRQENNETLEILRSSLPYNDSNILENEKGRITLKIFKH